MKTVTLQFEFLELNGKPMFNRETYDKPGQYVVTDGIAYHIISVPEEVEMRIVAFPVPKEVFEQKIRSEAREEGKADFVALTKDKFDKVISTLLAMKDSKADQNKTSGISEAGLLKIIEMLTKHK